MAARMLGPQDGRAAERRQHQERHMKKGGK